MEVFNDGFSENSDSGKPPTEQIERVKKWIRIFCRALPPENINYHYKSYRLKHCVERWWQATRPGTAYYVSNGAFIQAAIEMGYTAQPVGDKGDACFSMSVPPKGSDRRKEAGFIDLPAPRIYF